MASPRMGHPVGPDPLPSARSAASDDPMLPLNSRTKSGSVSMTLKNPNDKMAESFADAQKRYYIFVVVDLYFFLVAVNGVIQAEPEEGFTEEHVLCTILFIDVFLALAMAVMVHQTLNAEEVSMDGCCSVAQCNGLSCMAGMNAAVNAFTTVVWFYCRFGTIHHALLLILLGFRLIKLYPMYTFFLALWDLANDDLDDENRFKGIRRWAGKSEAEKTMDNVIIWAVKIFWIMFAFGFVGAVYLVCKPVPTPAHGMPSQGALGTDATTSLFASNASEMALVDAVETRLLDDETSYPHTVYCKPAEGSKFGEGCVQLTIDRFNFDQQVCCHRACPGSISVYRLPSDIQKKTGLDIAAKTAGGVAAGAATGAAMGAELGPVGAAGGAAVGVAYGVFSNYGKNPFHHHCYRKEDDIKDKERFKRTVNEALGSCTGPCVRSQVASAPAPPPPSVWR